MVKVTILNEETGVMELAGKFAVAAVIEKSDDHKIETNLGVSGKASLTDAVSLAAEMAISLTREMAEGMYEEALEVLKSRLDAEIKRQRKEEEEKQQARRDLHRILEAVSDINGLQASKAPHPTVFLEFKGQIGVVQVRIHRTGWTDDSEYVMLQAPLYREPYYDEITLSEMVNRLEEERERLV